jgi:hypothetical protein
MFRKDESLLIQVMNFLMLSCQLTHPLVSSAIGLWAGEVLMHLETYDPEGHLFQLYFSTLLSFCPLFDYLTCVTALNSITRILAKPSVSKQTFSEVYISRILQVLNRRSTVDDPDVIDAICICTTQFLKTFKDSLTETLGEFLFNLVIELLPRERFDPALTVADVLEALLACDLPPSFSVKFRLLSRLVGYHPTVGDRFRGTALDFGEAEERASAVVLDVFLNGAAWMVCAGIEFLRELLPGLVPTFEARLTVLLDSPVDAVASAAQAVLPLIFINDSS